MKLLNVSTTQEARNRLSEYIRRIPRKKEVRELPEAAGCRLAADVEAPADIPSFCRSVADGYAVRASDTYGASDSIPSFFEVVEDIPIGTQPEKGIAPGQCAYVPTGGMLPEGADAVVMVEHCELFDPEHIGVYKPAVPGESVMMPGEDMKKGTKIMEKGRKLRFQEIGALAAAGIHRAEVFAPFTVTIISTGDELAAPDRPLKPAQVYDSNAYALTVQARAAGLKVLDTLLVPDDEEQLRAAIRQAMETSDIVLTSGGSSQGKKDLTERLFDELTRGGVYIHGLALKPGKPTILAWDEKSSTVLAGLPGHPAAASTVFELLFGWLMRGWQEGVIPTVEAELTENAAAAPGRETCVPVKLIRSDRLLAEPVLGRSGAWNTLLYADGYILMGQNSEGMRAGRRAEVILFDRAAPQP